MLVRGAKIARKCKSCGAEFEARAADVKRGWGLYCSKSCKAIKQFAKFGFPEWQQDARVNKHKNSPTLRRDDRFVAPQNNYEEDDDYFAEDPSWDAHKMGA